jgi:hypothetical protein
MRRALLSLLLLLASAALGADTTPVATWSFDRTTSADVVKGFSRYVPGVSGTGLRFDGQTTTVVRTARDAPRLGNAFSIEAWVAIQEYPWTWCAIVNQETSHEAGYFFGIDPDGHFGLQLAAGGAWKESRSTVSLPLYAWNYLVATFDGGAVRLYLNGAPAGQARIDGAPRFAPDADVWIGRNHTPLGLSHEVKVVAPVAFSFNGIIDELRLDEGAMSEGDVQSAFRKLAPAGPAPLAPPVLPEGPKGKGRFGAYYTRLRYSPEWEAPWRVGDAADVVVRFDDMPTRLVFWRGTSYIPAWVTENGIWYTNEFYETQSDPMETSAEPMADKQTRFSQVRILESTDARVVVMWRYAPVAVDYGFVNVDPLSGWGDWVEEYFTVYPDGQSVRRITVWSSSPYVVPGKGPGTGGFRQYHEAIVINPPGTRPEDNIQTDALTIANMKGESHTYSWANEAPGTTGAPFDADTLKLLHEISDLEPETHKWLTQPSHGNILRVNLKAHYSPYVVVDPRHVAIDCYAGEIIRERSMFPWWNHWPVSQQIQSNGRWAIAPDRVSHSSLAHIQAWDPYARTPDSVTMLMLNGLTAQPATALVPLAAAWLTPPTFDVAGRGFSSDGFDPTERAFIGTRDASSDPRVEMTIRATAGSPVVNPAIVIRNWGFAAPVVSIDGAPAPFGKDVRMGIVHTLEGDDLVLWLRKEATAPVRVSVGE